MCMVVAYSSKSMQIQERYGDMHGLLDVGWLISPQPRRIETKHFIASRVFVGGRWRSMLVAKSVLCWPDRHPRKD